MNDRIKLHIDSLNSDELLKMYRECQDDMRILTDSELIVSRHNESLYILDRYNLITA